MEAALVVADPAYGISRKALRRLAGSGFEVTNIQDIFENSKTIVRRLDGIKANVVSFLAEVEQPGRRAFIHLATHAGTVTKRVEQSNSMGAHMVQGAIFLANPRVKTWPPLRQQHTLVRDSEDFLSNPEDETELIEALRPDTARGKSLAAIPGTLAADDILKRGNLGILTWSF